MALKLTWFQDVAKDFPGKQRCTFVYPHLLLYTFMGMVECSIWTDVIFCTNVGGRRVYPCKCESVIKEKIDRDIMLLSHSRPLIPKLGPAKCRILCVLRCVVLACSQKMSDKNVCRFISSLCIQFSWLLVGETPSGGFEKEVVASHCGSRNPQEIALHGFWCKCHGRCLDISKPRRTFGTDRVTFGT